jgi:hypothetical protein
MGITVTSEGERPKYVPASDDETKIQRLKTTGRVTAREGGAVDGNPQRREFTKSSMNGSGSVLIPE